MVKLEDLLYKLSPGITDIVVTFPGRFQPFGKHHLQIYENACESFGEDNVFIVTSNKIKLPDSPFSFEDKVAIISKFGISSDKIVQVRSPYNPVEVISKYNPRKLALFHLIGEKDADRMTYGNFLKNSAEVEQFNNVLNNSYGIQYNHISLEMFNGDEYSGTAIRKALCDKSDMVFKEVMGWYDENISAMIYDRLRPFRKEQAAIKLKKLIMPIYMK